MLSQLAIKTPLKGVVLLSDDGPICAIIFSVIILAFPTRSLSGIPVVRAAKSMRPMTYVGFADRDDKASNTPC